MSELISGKDVFIALAKGDDVQVHESTYKEDVWFNLIETNFSTVEILTGKVNNKPYTLKFRLKPCTININGFEVPAPFEPEYDDEYYHLDSEIECGYGLRTWSNHPDHKVITQFGAWRTEEEIKQVVDALRSVFK